MADNDHLDLTESSAERTVIKIGDITISQSVSQPSEFDNEGISICEQSTEINSELDSSSQSCQTVSLEFGENVNVTPTSSGNVSTSSSPKSRLPQRSGIRWVKGEKIEAMDFMKKWYPAKIMGIDEEEREVLIHFEGWNQRYDEWVDMKSEKLRPMTRHSHRKEPTLKKIAPHKVGQMVLARWTDCRMYEAKVVQILPNGNYEVMFYDGFKRAVNPINIRPVPDNKSSPSTLSPGDDPAPPSVIAEIEEQPIDDPPTEIPIASKEKETASLKEAIYHPNFKEQNDMKEKKRQALAQKKKKLIVAGAFFAKRQMLKSKKEPSKKKSIKKEPSAVAPKQEKKMTENVKIKQEVVETSSAGTEACDSAKTCDNHPTVSQKDIKISDEKATDSTLLILPDDDDDLKLLKDVPEKATSPVPVQSSPIKIEEVKQEPVDPPKEKIVPTFACPDCSYVSKIKRNLERHRKSRHRYQRMVTSGDRPRKSIPQQNQLAPASSSVPAKAFVIDPDHNPYKCTYDGCMKSFRKETLLDSHIKYYHNDDNPPPPPTVSPGLPPPPPSKKRRKTISICSTDSDASGTSRSNRRIKKRDRHRSADVEAFIEHVVRERTHSDSKRRSMDQPVDDLVDTEDEPEEVVNCMCDIHQEDGLMIQCDICLCWQHAVCFGIQAETLPSSHTCHVCKNPPGMRDSAKYIHDQEWLHRGVLPRFSFVPEDHGAVKSAQSLQSTNSLISDLHNVNNVLHSLKQQYKISKDKEHPEFLLWKKDWDKEKPLNHSPPDPTPSTSLVEHQFKSPSRSPVELSLASPLHKTMSATSGLLKPIDPSNSTENQGETSEVIKAGSKSPVEQSSARHANAINDVSKSETQVSHQPSDPAKANELEIVTDMDVSDEISIEIPGVADNIHADLENSQNSVLSMERSQNSDSSETMTASSIPSIDQSMSEQEFGALDGSDVNEPFRETEPHSNAVVVANENPFEHCEKHILQHLLTVQDDLESKLDLIEEQISALEDDDMDVHSSNRDILADVPTLKKSLKTVASDLLKIKRLAMFY